MRAGICGGVIDDSIKENLTEDNLIKLYALAKKHDLAHIVSDVLYKNKIMPDCEIATEYKNYLMVSLIRYQQMTTELKKMSDLLEQHNIPHILLKGAVIRKYYPEPWLRTSCDIDILIKKEDLQSVSDLFVGELNYSNPKKSSHDWSFFSKNNVHIEIHYELIESDDDRQNHARHKWSSKFLENVWETSVLVPEKTSEYKMTEEMFYYYHIVHMAKHFENGGCGVRTILDLWILNHIAKYDDLTVSKMLEQSGLTKFESAVKTLSEVWFLPKEGDVFTQMLEGYILTGGIYGTLGNRVAIHHNKQGGKLKYVLSRIFIPYQFLVMRYPILKKHKWLLPVCHVRRWFYLTFKGRIKHSINEMKINKNLTTEDIRDTNEFIKGLGL